jgi:hypothetical protein
MTDGFDMGGALDGTLPSFMPIEDCLLCKTRFRVMMGDKFWLCLNRLWKLYLQYLGNALMVVLSRAFQE